MNRSGFAYKEAVELICSVRLPIDDKFGAAKHSPLEIVLLSSFRCGVHVDFL